MKMIFYILGATLYNYSCIFSTTINYATYWVLAHPII